MQMGAWGVCTCVLVPLEKTSIRFSGAGVTAIVSHLMWVLGTRPRSSVRAASVLNRRAISTAPLLGS